MASGFFILLSFRRYMMSYTEQYNGWTNYETWLVALWLNGDQANYYALEELKAESESESSKAERLEELTKELYEFEATGLVADFVNTAFSRVNWLEIVSA